MAAPMTAQILLKIGDIDITVSHKNFYNLTTERTAKDVCDKFSLSILDDDVFTIEKALLGGNNKIELSYIDNMNDIALYDYTSFDPIEKSFTGYITTMSESLLNNRIMLTLNGIMSLGLDKKYDQYSVSWNVVPKFDIKKLLGFAYVNDTDGTYRSEEFLDQLTGTIEKMAGAWGIENILDLYNIPELVSIAKEAKSKYYYMDPDDYITDLFDCGWIFRGDDGAYYALRNSGDTRYYASKEIASGTLDTDLAEDVVIKAIGNYVIPIRIDKLLKLIFCGGKYSDLLEDSYSEYKKKYGNISFIEDNLTLTEWKYIQTWFKYMGEFPGLGFEKFNNDFGDLDVYQGELVQTKQSFIDFVYNNLLSKCSYTKKGKTYANFYITINNDKEVTLSRVDASKVPDPDTIPNYTYYSSYDDTIEETDYARYCTGIGVLTSFSPKLDILTSMLTNSSVANNSSDISQLNLVSTEAGANTKTVQQDEVASTHGYKIKWGAVNITSTPIGTGNKDNAKSNAIAIMQKAQNLAYTADATISGYNNLNPQEYIQITVLPGKDKDTSFVHHTSGIYFILSIRDTIQNGQWTSDLSLVKNINAIGNTAINTASDNNEEDIAFNFGTVHLQEFVAKNQELNYKTTGSSTILEMQTYGSVRYDTKTGKRVMMS